MTIIKRFAMATIITLALAAAVPAQLPQFGDDGDDGQCGLPVAQWLGSEPSSDQRAQYSPDGEARMDYTMVTSYQAARVANGPTITVDAQYEGRYFVGYFGDAGITAGDAFLGNVIDVLTADGHYLRLWVAFSSNTTYYIQFLMDVPGHNDITVTYDPVAGYVTWVGLR